MKTLNPRSEAVVKWLRQFEPADRTVAQQMLNRLLVVTVDEFEAWLRWVTESISKISFQPSAILPCRELSDEERRGGLFPPEGKPPIVDNPIGSEARIAHHFRAASAAKRLGLLLTPSIDQMRRTKIRNLIIIDDLIGSGERIVAYLKSILANATVRSWISFHLLRINIYTFASLPVGRRRLRTFLNQLPPSQQRAIQVFCEFECDSLHEGIGDELSRTYRKTLESYRNQLPHQDRYATFGMSKSMGRIVFEYRCPNNIPAIFWSYRPKGWQGLFGDRVVGQSIIAGLKSSSISHQEHSIKLSYAPRFTHSVLMQFSKGVRSMAKISSYLTLRQSSVLACTQYLQLAGLIDNQKRLTEVGKGVLKGHRKHRITERYLPSVDRDEVYLPKVGRSTAEA